MKKILLFIDNLGSGGAQRQLVNLGILFKERGYDVTMLVYQNYPFYNKLAEDNGIPIDLIESRGILGRIRRIRKYLRNSGQDVVIAFMETPGFLACFSKLGGARWKLVTNELSAMMSTFTSRKNKIYNKFEKYSDAKVCNSHNAKGMWEKYYPRYNDKYSVIYNPVIIPNEILTASEAKPENEKFVITVAASYQGLKNPIRVIEAVNMLTDEQKSKLFIDWYGKAEVTVGNTEVYDRAVALVEEYNLDGVVRLNHETGEIYNKMVKSDAVGLFSTVEGLPNAICEAMMLGKPIVMSRVSDYGILVDGNGFLCDPESVESIRDALAAMLDSAPDELARMSEISRERARELFSKDKVIERWINLIETL